MIELTGRRHLKFGFHPTPRRMEGDSSNPVWYEIDWGLTDTEWDKNDVTVESITCEGIGNGVFRFNVWSKILLPQNLGIESPNIFGIFGGFVDAPLYIGHTRVQKDEFSHCGFSLPSRFSFTGGKVTRDILENGCLCCESHRTKLYPNDEGELICPECNQR